MNDRLEASEWSFGDFYFVAWFHDRLQGLDLFVAHFRPKKVNKLRGNGRVMLSKVDNGRHAIGIGNGAALLFEVKTSKDVAGKHRLVKENLTPLGSLVEANAGAERLNILKLAKVRCGDVFAFYFGPEGKPSCTVGKVVGRQVCRSHGKRLGGRMGRWIEAI